MSSLLIGVVILVLIVWGLARVVWLTCLALVPAGHAAVVTRLGRPQRVIGPGLHLLLPVLDTALAPVRAELHDEVFDPTPIIDGDNLVHDVAVTVRLRVEDLLLATSQPDTPDPFRALDRLATTQLRTLLGTIPTADFDARADQVRQRLRATLVDAGRRLGVRVEDVRLTIEPHG